MGNDALGKPMERMPAICPTCGNSYYFTEPRQDAPSVLSEEEENAMIRRWIIAMLKERERKNET